jgi:uncharacterized SAM-binding protein YcdF (DUF218 family)
VARLVTRALAICVAALVVYIGATAVQVWLTSRRDEARPAQAIVVMGAAQYDGVPSEDLAARLDHALSLWRRGLAPLVVVTGGRQPGDPFTEAEVSAAYLEGRGIRTPGAIVQVGGKTSFESLSAASAVLRDRGDRTVILVSDGFHSARILDISRSLGLTAYPSPTTTSPISGIGAVPYFAKETVGVALGRVIGFGRLSALRGTLELAESALFMR